MPLRGAMTPARSQRARTSPVRRSAATTAKRGVPSPITISERPTVTALARSGQSAGTAPSVASSREAKTSSSPRATERVATPGPSRGLGPARSTRRARGRPARSAASRRPAARARHRAASSWLQLMRAPSIPAATSSSVRPGASVLGPSVAMIFVRRVVTRGTVSHTRRG